MRRERYEKQSHIDALPRETRVYLTLALCGLLLSGARRRRHQSWEEDLQAARRYRETVPRAPRQMRKFHSEKVQAWLEKVRSLQEYVYQAMPLLKAATNFS